MTTTLLHWTEDPGRQAQLEELVQRLRGKKIAIDLQATRGMDFFEALDLDPPDHVILLVGPELTAPGQVWPPVGTGAKAEVLLFSPTDRQLIPAAWRDYPVLIVNTEATFQRFAGHLANAQALGSGSAVSSSAAGRAAPVQFAESEPSPAPDLNFDPEQPGPPADVSKVARNIDRVAALFYLNGGATLLFAVYLIFFDLPKFFGKPDPTFPPALDFGFTGSAVLILAVYIQRHRSLFAAILMLGLQILALLGNLLEPSASVAGWRIVFILASVYCIYGSAVLRARRAIYLHQPVMSTTFVVLTILLVGPAIHLYGVSWEHFNAWVIWPGAFIALWAGIVGRWLPMMGVWGVAFFCWFLVKGLNMFDLPQNYRTSYQTPEDKRKPSHTKTLGITVALALGGFVLLRSRPLLDDFLGPQVLPAPKE